MIRTLGRWALGAATATGGFALTGSRMARAAPGAVRHSRQLLKAAYEYGAQSLGIVSATSAFVGMVLVLQGAVYVEQYQVPQLVGWFSGFACLRELGPMLIALMFSGRVGTEHTAELSHLRVTEQLDAVRFVGLDVYEVLVAPRALAMMGALVCLVAYGDLVAIAAGALCAWALVDIPLAFFFATLGDGLTSGDFVLGIEKAALYGVIIAWSSTHLGLKASGGAEGVGVAVRQQVVLSATLLFAADFAWNGLSS